MTNYFKFIFSFPFIVITLLKNTTVKKTLRFIKYCIEYIYSVFLKKKCDFPPVLLLSLTGECNLSCDVCFIHPESKSQKLSPSKIDDIFLEASKNKVKLIGITGGEPFLHDEAIKLIKKYPDIYFFIFTNGLVIHNDILSELSDMNNVLLLLGIDGPDICTDDRRGENVSKSLFNLMNRLKTLKIPFGASIMTTSKNINAVTSSHWIKQLKASYCSFILFVPYTPSGKGYDVSLNLSKPQIHYLGTKEINIQYTYHLITLSMHWLGSTCPFHSGKGLYISETGELGICPALPFSNIFINDTSIKHAYANAHFLKSLHKKQSEIETCIFRTHPEIITDLVNHHDACSKWNKDALNILKQRSSLKLNKKI